MARRSVKAPEPGEAYEPEYQPTDEEQAQWEEDARQAHEATLEPYRAVHTQQNDQDDLIAQIYYELTMVELGLM